MLDNAGTVIAQRHVAGANEGFSAHVLDMLESVLRTLGVEINEANLGPFAGENDGDGTADPDAVAFGTSSRDDGDLTGQCGVVVLGLRHD
ncbi:hypothetical protein D3C75_886260 [compost metagenome]